MTKKIAFFLLFLLSLQSCTTLLFEEQMPRNGKEVSKIPSLFKQTYEVKTEDDDNELFGKRIIEFNTIRGQYCEAKTYYSFTQEAFDTYAPKKVFEIDLDNAVFKHFRQDTTMSYPLVKKGNTYKYGMEEFLGFDFEKGLQYDLESGDSTTFSLISYEGNYFINTKSPPKPDFSTLEGKPLETSWEILALLKHQEGFKIRMVNADSLKSGAIRNIRGFKQLDRSTYLANPKDEEFMAIFTYDFPPKNEIYLVPLTSAPAFPLNVPLWAGALGLAIIVLIVSYIIKQRK